MRKENDMNKAKILEILGNLREELCEKERYEEVEAIDIATESVLLRSNSEIAELIEAGVR